MKHVAIVHRRTVSGQVAEYATVNVSDEAAKIAEQFPALGVDIEVKQLTEEQAAALLPKQAAGTEGVQQRPVPQNMVLVSLLCLGGTYKSSVCYNEAKRGPQPALEALLLAFSKDDLDKWAASQKQ